MGAGRAGGGTKGGVEVGRIRGERGLWGGQAQWLGKGGAVVGRSRPLPPSHTCPTRRRRRTPALGLCR